MRDFEKAIAEAKADMLPFESWERLAGESGAAYTAFCVFRDYGPERNIRKAVEANHEGKGISVIAKRYQLWRQWSMKFQWAKRATGYDQYLEKLKQGELRKTIEEQGKVHREITGKMLQVVGKKLDTMNPEDLTQGTVTEWVATAIKTEREMSALMSGKAEMKQGELVFAPEFNGL